MKIKLVAFGIARDILGNSKAEIELAENSTVSKLKEQLLVSHGAFAELNTLSFAVNEEYQSDDFLLTENDEVVIIPPVSGG